MAADTYEDLLNFQEHFEDAFAAHLSAGGITTYKTGDTESAPDDYTDVYFIPGGATGHVATRNITGTGEPEHDWFDGTLAINIRSRREARMSSQTTGINRRHAELVAKVRTMMLRGRINASTAFDLQHYNIHALTFASQADSISDEDRGIDSTILTYQISYYIKTDAWPSA